KIIGLDVSESQISEANRCNPFSNVEFKVSAAESLPVADASVDLLTACQCMHWFDIPAFLNEARRVLKLNGVLMVSRYTVPFLYTTNKESIPIINLIYDTYRSGVLQKYFNMDRLQYFDSGYAQVEFPFSDVSRRKTFMDEVVAGESCIDDVQSWSGFQILLQKEPSVAATVLADLRKNIISYFGENELSKIQLTFRREVDLVLCRK
ncbi:putative methyltransferase-like isoform X2, partial [Dinothrombium tinctorium]